MEVELTTLEKNGHPTGHLPLGSDWEGSRRCRGAGLGSARGARSGGACVEMAGVIG